MTGRPITRRDLRTFLEQMAALGEADPAARLQQAVHLAMAGASDDDVQTACRLAAAGRPQQGGSHEAVIQANEICAVLQQHTSAHIPLLERYTVADALWILGYRLTRMEVGYLIPHTSLHTDPPAPTHKRRVYEGQREPLPDSQDTPAEPLPHPDTHA